MKKVKDFCERKKKMSIKEWQFTHNTIWQRSTTLAEEILSLEENIPKNEGAMVLFRHLIALSSECGGNIASFSEISRLTFIPFIVESYTNGKLIQVRENILHILNILKIMTSKGYISTERYNDISNLCHEIYKEVSNLHYMLSMKPSSKK